MKEQSVTFPEVAHSAYTDLKNMGWQLARVENGITVFHPVHGGIALLDSAERNSAQSVLGFLIDDILKTRKQS